MGLGAVPSPKAHYDFGMDLVYPLKRDIFDTEFRWSLRSVTQFVPHDRIVIVGHKPAWAMNVKRVVSQNVRSPHESTTRHMRAACSSDELSDPFLWFNDDIFALKDNPSTAYNRGPIEEVLADYERKGIRSRYASGARETMRLLKSHGIDSPLSYELHVPIVVHKEPMLEALALGERLAVPHKRSIYGNLVGLGGATIPDVKVQSLSRDFKMTSDEWLSTSESSFKRGAVGLHVRKLFPVPCQYEGGKP